MPMALLTFLIARLPDAVVARLVRVEAGPDTAAKTDQAL
jgi:hypothetical protein